MWMNHRSSVCVANGSNNSTVRTEAYDAPEKPEEIFPYTPRELTATAVEFRSASRSTRPDFVILSFRVRRANYEPLLWQLITSGCIKKDHAYDSDNLPYWTIGMRVKVRNHLAMGRVMDAIRSRIGANCPGIKFCLDGFFGMRGFSDIFNNSDTCPWMEVSNFSTVRSLRLMHGDSVFISVATSAEIADVIDWRRKMTLSTKEPQPPPESPFADDDSQEHEDHSDVIGKIAYDSRVLNDLL